METTNMVANGTITSSNILIVDDTLHNLHLLSQMLTEEGYLVRGVSNGQMALTAVAAELPDLILLDIDMPDMDGYEVCRRLKTADHSRDIPVVFISALGDMLDKLNAFSVGGVDYIAKPFHLPEVLARVQTHLTLHHLRRQLEDKNKLLLIEVDERRRAEAALQELNEELEDRVAERTDELLQANVKLQAEMRERQRTEEAMRHAQKLEHLGVLAGGIAHDFNNMLSAMMAESSLALLKTAVIAPAYPHIENSILAAERATSLTRQLLAYAGKEYFERVSLDLNVILQDNLSLLKATIPKNVNLQSDLAPNLAPIMADAGQIQQLIMNLIINAAESYDGQEGTVLVQTTLCSVNQPTTEKRLLCLSVTDHGKGMDEAILTAIFDPFFSTKTSGRGLGLAAVQGIVHEHQGTIEVSSQPGQGTTFKVSFPIIEPDEDLSPTSPAAPDHFGTILLVDDEPTIRAALTEILELSGFTVAVAQNGQEALTLFEQQQAQISLIIMDMAMPVMMGHEALGQIRQKQPTMPVILLSGYGEQEAIADQQLMAWTKFLRKPFSSEKLIATINSFEQYD
jgi:CheY-like chemotaxis protein